MKAKLIKVDNGYVLLVDNIMYATDNDKLSKQNCDEIFRVVDVDGLATEYYKEYDNLPVIRYNSYTAGFNKAMELNKDKVFNLEDVKRAISFGQGMELWKEDEQINKFIQSLQQPIEIEVEIDMCDSIGISDLYTPDNKPKLDSSGHLILKKI